MRIQCDSPTSEVVRDVLQDVREVRQEAVEGQASTSKSHRTRNMPAGLQECVITSNDVVDVECEFVYYALNADTEPVNTVEALKDSRWVKVMVDEIKPIEDNDTWSLVKFPKGKKEINVKWVYKVMLNPKGEVIRHNARLIAKRFLQKEGIDYDEGFAPVARIEIIRLVIGLVNMHNWLICHMNVKCAFLNDSQDEEVYVRQPVKFVKQDK